MFALEALEAYALVVVRVTYAVPAVTVHFVAVVNCRSKRDTSWYTYVKLKPPAK